MTTDYGLSAMTGVLPTIIVAGFATQIAKQMVPSPERVATTRRRGTRTRTRRTRPTSSVGFGDFSNLGL